MTVTAHSESMLVAMDTNTQHAWIAILHNMQLFRTKYLVELLVSGDVYLHCRHVTYTLFTTCTYKATFIQEKEALGHTYAPMHIQRHTQLSLHTSAVYPSILTFCSVRATVTIHLSSHSPTSAAKQLSGWCALATSWKLFELDIDPQTQHSFTDWPIKLPAADRNFS